jgi:pimeloyl-ACP methyl ester carboxylesterase
VLGIDELGRALVAFMDEVGVDRASLVGNSMGCITAIEAARAAPERVERVVLVSPAGGPNNRPLPRGVGQLALDAVREPPRMALIAPRDYARYGLRNAARLFWSMIHYPTVDQLVHVAVPTLIVLGARDPLVNERRIVDGTAVNPRIAIARIDGAAHAMNFSHPQELAHVVRAFVRGHRLADDPTAPGTTVVLRQPIDALA